MSFLKIKSDEKRKVLLMFLFLAIVSAAVIIAENSRNAIFIKELGIQNYPLMYILNAIFLIFGIFLYTRIIDKWNRVKLFTWVIILFSLLLFVASVLAEWKITIPIMAAIVEIIDNFSIIIFAALFSFIFNIRQEKRLISIVASGIGVGGVIAVIIMSFLPEIIGVKMMIAVAGGIFSINIIVMLLLKKSVQEAETDPENIFMVKEEDVDLKYIITKLTKNKYIVLLVLIIFFSISIEWLIDFKFHDITSQKFLTEEEFSSFLGIFKGSMSLFFTLFNIFILSVLIRKIGFTKIIMIHPILMFFSGGFLAVVGGFYSGLFARFGNEFVLHTFERSLNHIFYSPLNEKVREKLRAFLEGMIKPIFICFASIVILLLIKFSHDYYIVISIIIMLFSVAWLITNIAIKKEYKKVLIENLVLDSNENREKIFKQMLEHASDESRDIILSLLNSNSDPFIQFALEMIDKHDIRQFNEIVFEIFEKGNPVFQHLAIKILLKEINNNYLLNRVNELFINGNFEQRQAILMCFADITFSKIEGFLYEWVGMEIDPESFILSLDLLVHGAKNKYNDFIADILKDLLNDSREKQITALQVIKSVGLFGLQEEIKRFINESDEKTTNLILSIVIRYEIETGYSKVVSSLKSRCSIDLIISEIANMNRKLIYAIFSNINKYDNDVRRKLWLNLSFIRDVKTMDDFAEKEEFTDDLELTEKISVMVKIKERLDSNLWELYFKDNINRSYINWYELIFNKIVDELFILKTLTRYEDQGLTSLFLLYHHEKLEFYEKNLLDLIYLILPDEGMEKVRVQILSDNIELKVVALEVFENILNSQDIIKNANVIVDLFEYIELHEKLECLKEYFKDFCDPADILKKDIEKGSLFDAVINTLILKEVSIETFNKYKTLFNKEGVKEMITVINRLVFLKDIPLFKSMNLDSLLKISMISNFKVYNQGDLIIQENEEGKALYIITKGKALVGKQIDDEWVRIAELNQGEFFGEMSIFTNELTSADIRAIEDCEILLIKKKKFRDLIYNNPELSFEIFNVLSRRLKKVTSAELERFSKTERLYI